MDKTWKMGINGYDGKKGVVVSAKNEKVNEMDTEIYE